MILVLILILKILGIIIPLLIAVAYFTTAERKIMGAIQRRRGSDVTGYAISLFVTKTFEKNKNTFELLLITPLVIGLFASAINNHTLNTFTAFLLSYLFICVFLGISSLFLILSYKITIQHITNYKEGDFENLKNEIINESPLTISKKSILFSFLSFVFSTIMMSLTFYHIAFVFIFLGGGFLLREIPLINNWIITLNQKNSEITKKFHDDYIKFYKFSKYYYYIVILS